MAETKFYDLRNRYAPAEIGEFVHREAAKNNRSIPQQLLVMLEEKFKRVEPENYAKYIANKKLRARMKRHGVKGSE